MDGGRRGLREEADWGLFKSRKGFSFRVSQAKAGPSNTSIRDLLSDDRYTETVPAFLGAMRVQEVKEGIYL